MSNDELRLVARRLEVLGHVEGGIFGLDKVFAAESHIVPIVAVDSALRADLRCFKENKVPSRSCR